MIPPGQIEQIKDSVDIVDVIGSFIKLTRRGRNYLALCPFHSEKTPSFTVSPDKQIYYCFGCGQGGNVINFVMNHEKMGFVEAAKYLAERAGISIAETSSKDEASSELRDRIYNANKVASEYFRRALKKDVDKIAASYLNERKIPAIAVEQFDIGYAPALSDGLIRFAKSKGVKPEELLAAGLIAKTSYGLKDFFRKRLMFPVKNLSGRVVAFGGRALDADEPSKYINTAETRVYHKGSQLFGLNLTKDYIRREKKAIVVEGYTDLISLYSADIKNVVCSSGTAFTSSQAALLSRFAEKVITLFDSDEAGVKAASRSVGELVSKGMEVSICMLPKDYDPDSFIKSQGNKQLLDLLENALPYPEFKKAIIGKGFRDLSVGEQEELIMELTEVISQIDNPLRRRLFTERLERAFDFPVSQFARTKTGKREERREQPVATRNRITLEREFLSLLADNYSRLPEIAKTITADCFTDDGCRIVYLRMIDEYEKTKSLQLKKWVDVNTPEKITETLIVMDTIKNSLDSSLRGIDDYIVRFESDNRKGRIRALKAEISAAEKQGDHKRADELLIRCRRIQAGTSN